MPEVLVPTLIDYAPEDLAAEMVPRLLSGAENWCQGFSEPGTGSNLGSLACRAERTEAGWLVNGQKVWTSLAQYATRCVLLTRTGTLESAHHGITALFVDMATPGITVRPIGAMHGVAEILRGLLRRRARTPRPVVGRGERGLGDRHGPAPLRAQHRTVVPRRLHAAATRAARRHRRGCTRSRGAGTGGPAALRVPGPLPPDRSPPGCRGEDRRGDVDRQGPAGHRRAGGVRARRRRSGGQGAAGRRPAQPALACRVPLLTAASIYGGSGEIQRNIIARRLLDLGDDR